MKLNTGLAAFTFISSFCFSTADSSASQKHKKRVHLRGRVANSMSDTVPVQPNSAAAADTNTDIGHYPWGLEQEDEPLGSAYLTLSDDDFLFSQEGKRTSNIVGFGSAYVTQPDDDGYFHSHPDIGCLWNCDDPGII
ncbi:hypothetical protein ACHAWC_003196 [Mediolabrus comicus]